MENNGENSGPLTSLPVDRLMATGRNAAARANNLFAIYFHSFKKLNTAKVFESRKLYIEYWNL